ncbi:MAG: hypothetical protein KGL39_39870 [Patescibacteria group bacterium]|nr:hypothetical protein [Patescibacteria group bacterium]
MTDPIRVSVTEDDIFDITRALSRMKPTFCMWWMVAIRKALADRVALGDVHATRRGMQSYFTDPRDGQEYTITIEPRR